MSAKKIISSKKKGDELEKLVSSYYEALGFRVTHNTNIGGHQIDLLASKSISGVGYVSFMVEVKSTAKKPIGINQVSPFKNTAKDLLRDGHIQGALLVTNGSFSQDAKLAVTDSTGISLTTVDKLEQDLFNYSESLLKICHDYESSDEARSYISLSGRYESDADEISDLALHLQEWSRSGEPLLVVSGDFGSGKTTILQRVFFESAKDRLRGGSSRYPVFFKLRNLPHHSTLWDFVAESLRDNNYVSPTQRDFERQRDSGQLLILLDGFDEIDTGANAREKANHLKFLSPLLASPSPCVLSTRPTYFESFDEMSRSLSAILPHAPTFKRLGKASEHAAGLLRRLKLDDGERIASSALRKVITISQLSDKKVLEYLTRHEAELFRATRCSVQQVRDFLFRIYDLEDLMKRPLLLNMVVQTILAGSIDVSDTSLTLGPATLYEIYTQICAKRDVKNRPTHQFLSEEERLKSCRELALLMLEKSSIVLTNSEVIAAIERANLPSVAAMPKHRQTDGLESALTDIRVCTFLSFSDDGSLRFAHKSFFEFFVAQSLVIRCQDTASAFKDFAGRRLPREVAYFLGSFARDQEAFGNAVLLGSKRANLSDAVTTQFFHRLAFASGTLISNANFSRSTIDSVDLRKVAVVGTSMMHMRLRSVTLREVHAKFWKLQSIEAKDVSISSSSFLSSIVEIRASEVTFENCNFDKETEISINGTGWNLRRCSQDGGVAKFGGAGRLLNTRFQDTKILLTPGIKFDTGTRASFMNCKVIADEEAKQWRKPDTKFYFERCKFAGFWLEASEVISLAEGSRGSITFDECEGVVLTSDDSKVIKSDVAKKLSERHPNVVFCDTLSLRGALIVRKNENSRDKKIASRQDRSGDKSIEAEGGRAELPIIQAIAASLRGARMSDHATGILLEALRASSSRPTAT